MLKDVYRADKTSDIFYHSIVSDVFIVGGDNCNK